MKKLFLLLALAIALDARGQNPNPAFQPSTFGRTLGTRQNAAQARAVLELPGGSGDYVVRGGTNMTGGLTNNIRFFGRFVGDGSALTNLPSTHTNFLAPTNIFVNVKAAPFNALGNDVADDRPAIQAAINAARDAGGGTVFFPAGIYRISETPSPANSYGLLVSRTNIHLLGSGMGATVIKWLDAEDASDGAVIFITGNNHTFENITVDGNKTGRELTGSADFEGWNVSGFTNISFVNCAAVDCAGDGYDVENGRIIQMLNCRSEASGGVGFSFQANNVTLANLFATNNGIFSGSGDDDNAGYQFTQCEAVTMTGCVGINNRRNLYATSSALAISGCQFVVDTGTPFSGRVTNVWVNGAYGTISGCRFSHYGASGPNLFVTDNGNVLGLNIAGNRFQGTDGVTEIRNCPISVNYTANTANGDVCISVTNSPRVVITGNYLRGDTYGAFLKNSVRDTVIENNSIFGGLYGLRSDGNSTNVFFCGNKIEGGIGNYVESAERWQLKNNVVADGVYFDFTGNRNRFDANHIPGFHFGSGSVTNLFLGNTFGAIVLGASLNDQIWRNNFYTNLTDAFLADAVGVVTNKFLAAQPVVEDGLHGIVSYTARTPGFYRVSGKIRSYTEGGDGGGSQIILTFNDGLVRTVNLSHVETGGTDEFAGVTFFSTANEIRVDAIDETPIEEGLKFDITVSIEKLGGGP